MPESSTTTRPFTFICGNDDYLVNRQGDALFKEYTKDLADSFSKEIIDGSAHNVSEVQSAVKRVIEAVQTLSLFGDKKVVWFKGLNFMSDTQTGRAEGTKAELDALQKVLLGIDPSAVTMIITAHPIDRRTRHFKALQNASDFTYIETNQQSNTLEGLLQSECQNLRVSIDPRTVPILIEKVGNNSRLLIQETHKLAAYLGEKGGIITESLVNELVPQFGEGDFFEASEAFFSLNLQWTLEALKRHFFTQKEGRPIITSLQNRNRLLIQLRVLLDAQTIRVSHRGVDKTSLQRAASDYNFPFGDPKGKSSFNLFSQNPWYLGKLVQAAQKAPLRKLINFQQAFLQAFEGILQNPTDQHAVLSSMAFHCLG